MFSSLSPFWNGFIIGATLFAFIGASLGILVAAMCQAAAVDDHRRGFIDGDEPYRRITGGFEPDGGNIRHKSSGILPVNGHIQTEPINIPLPVIPAKE